MHIKSTEEMAEKVEAVLLDGKPVSLCHEANEEEGWVTFYYPKFSQPSERVLKSLEEEQIVESAPADLILMRKTGEVKIILKQND